MSTDIPTLVQEFSNAEKEAFEGYCPGSGYWYDFVIQMNVTDPPYTALQQLQFCSLTMAANTKNTPWTARQIVLGALYTNYNGRADYTGYGSSPDYQPPPPVNVFDQVWNARLGSEGFPDKVDPSIAYYGHSNVYSDRYTSARIIRLSIALLNNLRLSTVVGGSGSTPYNPNSPVPTSPAGSAESDAIKSAASLAATLSFALPAPYGAIASVGFDLVSMFLSGGSSDTTTILLKEMESVKTQLETYIAQVAFDTDFSNISTCSGSVNDKLHAMQNMGWQLWSDPGWDQLLQSNTQPTGACAYSATREIWDLWLTSTEQIGALDAWVAGESVILTCIKLQLQTAAVREAQARTNNDWETVFDEREAWWGFYNTFQSEVQQQSAAIQAWIIDQIDDRLAQVVGPCDINSHSEEGDIGETFSDPGIGDDGSTHGLLFDDPVDPDAGHPDAQVSDPYILGSGETISTVRYNYITYLANLADDLDASYAGAILAVNSWVSSLNSWQVALPPAAPATAPSVKISTGVGGTWPADCELEYSYALGNSKGIDTPSLTDDPHGSVTNWSLAVTCETGQYPTLTFDTTTDTNIGGVTRYVYRKLLLAGSATPIRQCVTTIPVAQSMWTDGFVHPPMS